MITIIILMGTALVLIVLLWVARGVSPRVTTPEELLHLTSAVDLAAFRNLIDPEEDFYLRVHLSRADYKRVRSARQKATLEYVKAIAHNASVLVRLAESAKQNGDAEVVLAAWKLGESAIQLRIAAIAAMLRIRLSISCPRLPSRRNQLAERYQQLTARALDYVSLCQPSQTSTIASVL